MCFGMCALEVRTPTPQVLLEEAVLRRDVFHGDVSARWGLALALLVSGCVADETLRTFPGPAGLGRSEIPAGNATDGLPPYAPLPDPLSELSLRAFGDASGGVRIRLWNDRAYVTTGNAQDGIAIFDVSNPVEPERIGSVTGIAPREGLDVLNYGDRVVVVVSIASPVAGPIVFFDVTDPGGPKELARLDVQSHTVAAYRPGHVVYNAGFATGPIAGLEIINARDPDNIRLEKTWNWGTVAADGTPIQPTGCHDIIVDHAAARAYCAAQAQTLVWDVSNPLNPRVLTVLNDPVVPHHNTAFPILDGRVLVIGDEEAGCGPTIGGVSTPAGLWFYDLQSSPPALLSWLSLPANAPQSGCAPHFGSEVGNGTGFVAFGWFSAGLVLVDASDPWQPRIAHQSQEGGSGSDAVYYRGLVFVAGQKGGLQVAVPG